MKPGAGTETPTAAPCIPGIEVFWGVWPPLSLVTTAVWMEVAMTIEVPLFGTMVMLEAAMTLVRTSVRKKRYLTKKLAIVEGG
jgi:hypothetical protein